MYRRSFLLLVILFTLDEIIGQTTRCSPLYNMFRHRKGSRVLGGAPAIDGQFPYIVSLRINNYHICGGSILTESWIVTAAHCCLTDTGDLMPLTEIVASTVSLSNNGIAYQPDQIISHPQFYRPTWLHDICLIKTKEPIAFNDMVKPIQISMKDPQPGDHATALGWGVSDPQYSNGGPNTDMLQYLYVNVMDVNACSSYYAETLTEDHTCTFATTGTGTCIGDSGGPVSTSDGLIGITSRHYGPGCGQVPDADVRVKNYVSWIASIINQ